MAPTVVVSSRGEERLRSGHPWIYRTDVADARAGAGDIVQVRNARGRALGSALFSDRSQITLRMLSYGDALADEGLLRARIATALAFRQGNFVPPAAKTAGIQANDIILGIDGKMLEMTMLQFNAFIRLNYKVGDRVTYNVVRDGKRLDIPTTLPKSSGE